MKRILFIFFLVLIVAGWLINGSLKPLVYEVALSDFEMGARDSLDTAKVVLNKAKTEKLNNKPNIIVILADDLGWGDIGVQGTQAIETPNIDQLAKNGIRLTDFYASAPVCSPSRAGLLTGRYPLRSGFASILAAADDTFIRKTMMSASVGLSKLGMSDMAGGSSPVKGLPLSEVTIPEALKLQGYKTLGVGKWHLGDFTQFPQYHPSQHGFDHFFGYNMSNDDWPVAMWRDNEELIKDIGINQKNHTKEFTEEAVKYIHQWQDKPYFIYLAHKDPHQPFYPSDAFKGKSKAGPYGDVVSEFDWGVGEVIKALKETNQLENTIVIVTSDNGPWFEGDTAGLRGRKGQSYEGGFRVPFIASWPKKIPQNVVSNVPTMNIDIFPTVLSLAGLDVPNDRVIDGVDITSLLTKPNEHNESLFERPLYFFHEYTVEAVRQGKWKYINDISHYVWPIPLDKNDLLTGKAANSRDYYPEGSDVGIPTLGAWPLLYNMQLDKNESYNVSKTYPDISKRLQKQLVRWESRFKVNPRGWK